ncbi:uncharacterized protein ACA1_174120 [Acanthamoeba castellanii str. Neff]|uniref:Uncharacterized protein n=1 Tax=Acanthamoeba castellanii (strain ATCC 30010 / Neff) TaxID=1257118 RepID=L8HJ79_ACACF|nr:uncharacterized protein ACA1_174120 [Acanthamoeba castellanii str. Neff]ELR24753.1 hypothetical protein ACA1_174120 [Acanthamoeba castellanii str. Neff]
MEQHLEGTVGGPLVWVDQPPLEEALMAEARWAEVHYRWNGLITQQHEHALYWFGDWERENASSLLFLRARPPSPLDEGSVAGGTAGGGWRCERLFELPRPAPGEVGPSWPRTAQQQQQPEADSDNREEEEEEEASAVVLTSTSHPDRAVVVGSDGLGHLFVADVGRGEEAAELQAAVEGGAGRVVVYEDLACPSPGEEGGALVPRPFVVVAAALYPGDRELLALAYYMTPSPATVELHHQQHQQARWHHHLVLLSVTVVERLVGLHRPYSASFVADARGIPSSFVLVSEGVFGRSIDAVARFLPGRPAISPLVQLPGDPSQPSPRQSLQHSGEEQPDEEDEEEMAEAINARLEMETEDIDFFGSESTYDDDEEIADVRSTRSGTVAGGSTGTWGVYRYRCLPTQEGGDSQAAVALTHLYSLGVFPVMGVQDISPTDKYILAKCDVDCLVYKLSFGGLVPMSLAHVDVFAGLAYIEAGKRHKKATLVSATRAHAVILEGSRFVYVYHHAAPGSTKSGHTIVEDETGEDILGWQFVGPHHLAFLTRSKLEIHPLI